MPFLTSAKDGTVLLHVYVQPRASKTRVVGLHDGLLKIGVASPPVDGKANQHVVKFLAKLLKISKSDIVLQSGAQSRRKTLKVFSCSDDDIRRLLGFRTSKKE